MGGPTRRTPPRRTEVPRTACTEVDRLLPIMPGTTAGEEAIIPEEPIHLRLRLTMPPPPMGPPTAGTGAIRLPSVILLLPTRTEADTITPTAGGRHHPGTAHHRPHRLPIGAPPPSTTLPRRPPVAAAEEDRAIPPTLTGRTRPLTGFGTIQRPPTPARKAATAARRGMLRTRRRHRHRRGRGAVPPPPPPYERARSSPPKRRPAPRRRRGRRR